MESIDISNIKRRLIGVINQLNANELGHHLVAKLQWQGSIVSWSYTQISCIIQVMDDSDFVLKHLKSMMTWGTL